MKLRDSVLILFLLFLTVRCFAQESLEEKLLEGQAESSDQSELFEILAELRENPVDVNRANTESLQRIPGLSAKLARAMLEYRQQHGPFENLEGLLAVPGMDSAQFSEMRQFLTVHTSRGARSKHLQVKWRSRVLDRIDLPQGFRDGRYESSARKLYHRFQFDLNHRFQGGLLLEKDSGEKRLDDLKLYYASAKLTPQLTLLLGNYVLEFAQGLVLWGPYGFSKGAGSLFSLRKRGRGLRGYSSVDENASLFGAAAAAEFGSLRFVLFSSKSELDATPISDNAVSGLFTSGLHRNGSEKNKRDRLTETLSGGRIEWEVSTGLSLATTYYHANFDKEIEEPDLTRNHFKFRGKNNSVVGFDWGWAKSNFDLFGEAARSSNGGHALILGTLASFPTIRLGLLFREYQKDYQNFHSFGFAERNGTTQNERGFYTGIEYKLSSRTKLVVYYDIFSNPWRTFFKPVPTEGNDLFSQLEHHLDRRTTLTIRYRLKNGQDTQAAKDQLNRTREELVQRQRRQWRLQLDHALSSRVRLSSRIEYVRFRLHHYVGKKRDTKATGNLFFQEVRWQPKRNLRISARVIFFDTDSFDSRLFEYESDLPGMVTNRALFGRGTRWYLLLKYKVLKTATFALKYSETFREDQSTIGSGPDQIAGPLDRRYGVQFEWRK
ncbi:MAG: ComEA family DNA-binding protein [bacterium]